jgi:hypothetical protein
MAQSEEVVRLSTSRNFSFLLLRIKILGLPEYRAQNATGGYQNTLTPFVYLAPS